MSIEIEEKKHVVILTINRPEVYNALNKKTKWDLVDAIYRYNQNENIKSIIIKATGKAFCSGQDLNDRMGDTPNLAETLHTEWFPLITAMRTSPKIIINVIEGVVAGAGIGLSLTGDLIVAKRQIRFVPGFNKLGLVPDSGASYFITKAFGPKVSLEFFMGLCELKSDDLYAKGLINKLHDNPLELALNWAETIGQSAPLATRELKQIISSTMDGSHDQGLYLESKSQAILGSSKDYKEGISAFFEKRAPLFKGN